LIYILGDIKMMKLDEFITQTINQIIDGVAKSQEHAKEANAYVNAPIIIDANRVYDYYQNSLPQPQIIEFDIAITTTESKGLKGGAGIFVASFGVGYQGEKSLSGMEVSRIKFSIPVVLPSQHRLEPARTFTVPKDN
jgi:hypothetical protein